MRGESSPSANLGSRFDGWQGVALIAATYVYFLIFAQFGFLKRLDALGLTASHLKLVMAAMAAGGILSSLLAPRTLPGSPALRLRIGLAGCGATALLTPLPLATPSAIGVSFFIGASLGLLTVTLVSTLDLWLGSSAPLLKAGLGTGCGYFLCNVPALFTASPTETALAAALVCFLAVFATRRNSRTEAPDLHPQQTFRQPPFGVLLACFTALVWLDSAAFFIIQNSPTLKASTWQGTGNLWRTGALHLAAALLSVWLIRKRGLLFTLFCAFAALGGACLLLLHPDRAGLAALLYPAGVSLYSVALVAAPAFLLRTTSRVDRARKAGWIYAVAGWIGSALGIGMAQNLHHVPAAFLAFAGFLFAVPLFFPVCAKRLPQVVAVMVFLGLGFGLKHLLPNNTSPQANSQSSLIARGRRVYIAEGCIHCHSQYVRPNSPDVLLWGPASSVETIRQEKPPLIGNRRQGPDLSEVGARRSLLWLRLHLIQPRDLNYGSIMPSYGYLFRDNRGAALVAYLAGLKSSNSEAHLREAIATWSPQGEPIVSGIRQGRTLFAYYCATCHSPTGVVRKTRGSCFRRIPPNLKTDPLQYVPRSEPPPLRQLRIARITKFGIPGTDMPGHEYLADAQIQILSAWVARISTARGRTR